MMLRDKLSVGAAATIVHAWILYADFGRMHAASHAAGRQAHNSAEVHVVVFSLHATHSHCAQELCKRCKGTTDNTQSGKYAAQDSANNAFILLCTNHRGACA